MRVIAGIHKGRSLKPVPGKTTRPTTDKVKEAVFHFIGPFFNDGRCLDLFAGSGALGIEALSRGMEHAIFVDKQAKAIETIKQNISSLAMTNKAEVYRTDAFRAIKAVAKRELDFHLIVLDPPYSKVVYEKLMKAILKQQILAEKGIILCEHDVHEKLPQIDGLEIMKQQNYGGTTGITIYKKGDM